ncbi:MULTISPECIES: hypothetical protein [Corallococcus]|uniref:hypothetical protein n=1 Tax=Corallococcus TaxID=83461 RepID=UPI00117C80D9|nr:MULTISPECIES: hypothetical protein [Corallococcus]NBD12300.1 hypothetical protein [Corallococcus silvisoli]TSC25252.1 hypothetical protein FOF48_25315 [Corallococcus sp. Z5C101001]
MKRFLFVAMAVLGLQAVACGGPMDAGEPGAEPPAADVTAMSVCSTTCPGGATLSCTGNVCNAVQGQSVTCDGQRSDCPTLQTVTFYCEAGNTTLSCSGYSVQTLPPQGNKICGGVSCDGASTWCPAFTDDRECF